ncbi:hypothetical protein AB205_0011860, partial [Aquarana catesbeiana]
MIGLAICNSTQAGFFNFSRKSELISQLVEFLKMEPMDELKSALRHRALLACTYLLGHKGTGGSALPDCSQVDSSFVPSSNTPPSIPIEDGPIDIKYEAALIILLKDPVPAVRVKASETMGRL